ncbi:DUF4465 domain-containing protein [Cytophagaceae bacterium ABcell3]|nr:DUF4465 domain-containing protein [Cytophagaceae bacterium ABcell3]
MKHNYLTTKIKALALTLVFTTIAMCANAQEVVDFEDLTLEEDSYWNGSDESGGFTSGGVFFPNGYNTEWDFWNSGFAYSNKTDTTTPGHENIFSAFTGSGYGDTDIYGLGKNNSQLKFPDQPNGVNPESILITNTTFAVLSMREGDQFAKPFGGEDGNDPDWFLLTITGFRNGQEVNETVEFYLADYRFEDNSENYIVEDWEWVDLEPLGTVDSIRFNLASSDVNDEGQMNTPDFFAFDHFTYNTDVTSIASKDLATVKAYPNPASEVLYLQGLPQGTSNILVTDFNGKALLSQTTEDNSTQLYLNDLTGGLYLVHITSTSGTNVIKFVKQ